ncbi:MAG: dihydrolipoyl dehydrogenase family protein [Acidimicrobiales bacterium]
MTEVVVIGGGAGGLTAATQAARLGARTTLITDGPLGGDCTYTGCVPSKALIAAAAVGRTYAEARTQVHSAITTVAATEDEAALARADVSVLRGRSELLTPRRVRVGGREFDADHIVLATGSEAVVPPVPGLADIGVRTNTDIFELADLPSRLAVIGGGAIGCELAQAFARLGSSVTVVDQASRVLASEDPEASAVIHDALVRDGVTFRLGATLTGGQRYEQGRHLSLADGSEVRADEILVAAGRRPVTLDLGLVTVGVTVDDQGYVVVDDTCATNVDGVWAVGDVTPLGGFTHVAGHMGFVAASNICRNRFRPARKVDRTAVPRVTYTDPEVAHVGMTEAQVAARGGRVAFQPLTTVDRAVTDGRTSGFVKLMAGPNPVLRSLGGGRVLGATIVSPRAGELITEVTLAIRTHMFTGRLAQTIHPYPSWSMAVQQAASQFFYATDGREARPART